jgi:hypothetical protein
VPVTCGRPVVFSTNSRWKKHPDVFNRDLGVDLKVGAIFRSEPESEGCFRGSSENEGEARFGSGPQSLQY